MKKCFFVFPLLLLLVVPARTPAQIPNPGFETWTGTTSLSLPGWYVNNLPGLVETVTRSTTPHSGTYAAQGSVAVLAFVNSLYPPWLQSWFPFTERPGMLTGYLAFTSAGHDSLEIATLLYKNSVGQGIATGSWGTATSTTGYTKFSIPLEYVSAETPDTAWIWVIIDNGDNDTLHLGTTFLLDDLAYEGTASGISSSPAKPTSYALQQNYPNPFNPTTTIRFELPQAGYVRLSVYNLLGEELAVLVNEQRQPGVYDERFDASGLPSGTYFYRIQVQNTNEGGGGNFVQVRKMTILR